jgi:RNA polymerase sigma factor (sigma-70 family)
VGNVEEESVLIRKVLDGNVDAFEPLIRRFERLVNHIVFRTVDNDHDREDICQDIFLRVYRNLSYFRSDCKLSTWVAKIAYNRCYDYLAAHKANMVGIFDSETGEDIADSGKTPYEEIESKDISALLQSEINDLPIKLKTIVTLYHLDNMSYDEIGQIMRLPEGTVKSFLFRARRMLLERLTLKYSKEELWH